MQELSQKLATIPATGEEGEEEGEESQSGILANSDTSSVAAIFGSEGGGCGRCLDF